MVTKWLLCPDHRAFSALLPQVYRKQDTKAHWPSFDSNQRSAIGKHCERAAISSALSAVDRSRYLMCYFMLQAFCDDRVDVPIANGVACEVPASSLLPGTGNA
jgi:hypothetical protein